MNTHHLSVGEKAPDFTANTTSGTVDFYRDIKGWVAFLSHLEDIGPVLSTEIEEYAQRNRFFPKEEVTYISRSSSKLGNHVGWSRPGLVRPNLLVIADAECIIARRYGM
jgi:peroxiredoxin (alkyl hydroperoxide reductase subunit C)